VKDFSVLGALLENFFSTARNEEFKGFYVTAEEFYEKV
jgi:hypothetical protein